MARKKTRVPGYCRQKRSGKPDLAYVEFEGTRFYLGTYGTRESRGEYRRLTEEWKSGNLMLPDREPVTVMELIARFWEHAEAYYRRPDGTATAEARNFKAVLRDLKELYGETAAKDFGPRRLKTLRSKMIDRGLARTTINSQIKRVRTVFRWATEEELVPAAVHEGLRAVRGLAQGRSDAREPERVQPVPAGHVSALRRHLPRQVWSLIELQLLTGARPGELLRLRACDIQKDEGVWTYLPRHHKTAHRGHGREILFGPRAQVVLRSWLDSRPLSAPLFSPAEAEKERRDQQHAERKTPPSCGNRPGTNRRGNPRWKPGEYYSVDSYRRAIRRACEYAGVPPWSPHRLRHNAGTEIRREFGLETTRIVLGHQSAVSSEIYAERDRAVAVGVMEKIG